MDRDLNAAINILKLGLMEVEKPEFTHVKSYGELKRRLPLYEAGTFQG
ncbi:MAG: hypothetical protein QXY52_06725 [Conexivisphaerales archaeon]